MPNHRISKKNTEYHSFRPEAKKKNRKKEKKKTNLGNDVYVKIKLGRKKKGRETKSFGNNTLIRYQNNLV